MPQVNVMNADELLLKRLVTESKRNQSIQQYKLAIDSYSKILELIIAGQADQRRDMHLARSACYVAAGLPKEAVSDADAAIELDSGFCQSYFQKAEAYFSFGQFEQALVNYYAAYQRRPDIEEYRLGVQKAESAILSAVSVCIQGEDLGDRFGAAEPSVNQLKDALLRQDDYPKQKCLCGCQGCDSRRCGDFAEDCVNCGCRCAACVRHNLYKHNLIYEPVVKQYVRVPDLFRQEAGNSTSATPVQHQEKKAEKTESKKGAYKTSLEKDQAFFEVLRNEPTLDNVEFIKDLATQSSVFIQTKNNFWEQQGNQQNSMKKTTKKQPPQKLPQLNESQQLTESQIIELDDTQLLQRVLQKIQQSQTLLNAGDYQQALLIMQTVEKQADQIQIAPETDKLHVMRNEKARLMADAYSLTGSVYYRLNQLDLAIQQFACALDHAYEYVVIPNPNVSQSKKEQQVYEKQVINQKALMVRALRILAHLFLEQLQFSRAIQVFEELVAMDYLPYLKVVDLQLLAHCYFCVDSKDLRVFKTALDSVELVTGEQMEFKMRKKYQLKLMPVGVRQFNEAAPLWTGQPVKPIKDVYYDAMWLMYLGALNLKEDGVKKATGILKDGLLFAERAGDQLVGQKFLQEVRRYEDVE